MAIVWRAWIVWATVAGFSPCGQLPIHAEGVPQVSKVEPVAEWNARFAGKEGWIGGDGAYTVVLDPKRVLWLFGDSLVGTVKDGKRAGAVMVHNSVAVQTRHDRESALRFVVGRDRDGKPAALFAPADGKGWFWPLAAFRGRERLFVFLARIDKGTGKSVLGFRHSGQVLAVIENPDEEPLRWRVKQHPLPFARFEPERIESWGSAVLESGAFLYVYGYQEQGKAIDRRKLMTARVPAEKLADFSAWRFRGRDGWSDKSDLAAPLAAELATEFSVSRMPGGKGFVLVYTENGLSDRIVARFAEEEAGPWSAPVLLYRCPEMVKDRGLFCYSAKAHPWAVKDGELLVSYCVNAWDFGRLWREDKMYRPKFVRVKLKLGAVQK